MPEEKALCLWRGLRGALYPPPEPNPKVKDRVRETKETDEHSLTGTQGSSLVLSFLLSAV